MKTHFTRIFILIISIFSFQNISANAAQPGVWNAGGTVFTMMYPEDTATFKKVQMQEEKIYMQLYPGFAVVKGWYKMRNTSKESLSFKMGYPINGIYSGGNSGLNQIHLDSLTQFKIFSNKIELPLIKTKLENESVENIQSFSNNWLVWEMDFLPEETKIVEVYFLVETNNGKITKGYNADHYNAFIYLLESGSVWKQPIENGDFFVQMMQGLTEKDVRGMSTGFQFLWNKKLNTAKGFKTNFSPTEADNLIITYSERNESFNFSTIISEKEKWYQFIDEFSENVPKVNFTEKMEDKNPYEVSESFLSYLPMALMALVVVIPVLIVLALLFFLIKKFRKK